MIEATPNPSAQPAEVELLGFDHVEFWVGNAKQAAYYYEHAFGFRCVAYAGPETGVKDRASYVMRQNDVVIVLTCPMGWEGDIADHVRKHGDGVKDVAFRVRNADQAFGALTGRGAAPVAAPATLESPDGPVRRAAIGSYGETIHSLVARDDYAGVFLPGYEARAKHEPTPFGLGRIDHVVGNVGWNEMQQWVDHYVQVFGFHPFISFDDQDISTEYTALRSVVVANPSETVKMPLNEPAEGKKRSQIEEYIDFYGGPGVQHLALTTADIVRTVTDLMKRGVEFLAPPAAYYEQLTSRLEGLDFQEDIERLKPLGILVDRDDKGYLLQIFTKPLTDRPTVFFEIIQRKGSDSFGKGNFKALFEAIEAEQARRGTL